MKLHHFHEVVAIAERGGIRAAARHLQVAQPALTRSLADLERELGAPLFERRARGVVATPLGEAFVRRATLILHEVRRTQEEVDQIRGSTSGNVTVGLSIAAHLSLLPKALAPFRRRYPGFISSRASIQRSNRDCAMARSIFTLARTPVGKLSRNCRKRPCSRGEG